MKKYFLGVMALSATIALSACSNSGGGNSNDGAPAAIPEDLSFQPQGGGLSQSESGQLRAYFAAAKAANDKNIPMMLPELLRSSQNEDDSDRREREEDFAKLNSREKSQVEQARRDCQYTENETPNSDENWALGKPHLQVTEKILSGAACPVAATTTNTQTTTILSYDQNTDDATGKLAIDTEEVTSVKNPVNMDAMAVVYRHMTMHMKALVDKKGSATNIYAVGPMHMNASFTNGQTVVLDGTMQMLQNSRFRKTVFQGTITVNGRQYSMSMFKLGDDSQVGDLYLNGEKMDGSFLH